MQEILTGEPALFRSPAHTRASVVHLGTDYPATRYTHRKPGETSVWGAVGASVSNEDTLTTSPEVQVVTVSLEDGPFSDLRVARYLLEALRERRHTGAGPFTVISRDAVSRNGDAVRNVVLAVAGEEDPDLAAWIAGTVTFPNTLSLRINKSVNYLLHGPDGAPGYPDAYTIVEDRFSAGHPDWEGVLFVDDIAPYEDLLHRFETTARFMLGFPAFLAGYRTAGEALSHLFFRQYLQDFLDADLAPLTEVPAGAASEAFRERVFGQLMADIGEEEIHTWLTAAPDTIVRTIPDMSARDGDFRRVAFLLACYGHYLAGQVRLGAFDSEALPEEDILRIQDENQLAFLRITPLAALEDTPLLAALIRQYRKQLDVQGVMPTLAALL